MQTESAHDRSETSVLRDCVSRCPMQAWQSQRESAVLPQIVSESLVDMTK